MTNYYMLTNTKNITKNIIVLFCKKFHKRIFTINQYLNFTLKTISQVKMNTLNI